MNPSDVDRLDKTTLVVVFAAAAVKKYGSQIVTRGLVLLKVYSLEDKLG